MTDLQLRGIIPATVTPFMPDGSLDEQGLRRYLTWLEEQDVHGVTVHADTGEVNTLTPEERVRSRVSLPKSWVEKFRLLLACSRNPPPKRWS